MGATMQMSATKFTAIVALLAWFGTVPQTSAVSNEYVQPDGFQGMSQPSQSRPGMNSYARFDYLMWWAKETTLPALVTTSPNGTPRLEAGVLGETGTSVLFGDQEDGGERRNGGRLTLGHWFDEEKLWGVEGSWTVLDAGEGTGNFQFESDGTGSPIIARPFFDISTGQQASSLVAYPGIAVGSVQGELDNEINSANIMIRKQLTSNNLARTDLLMGYRYFSIDESLSITEQLTSIDPGGLIPFGTEFDVLDQFDTQSDFHGAEIGILHSWRYARLMIRATGKVALGNVHNQSSTNGLTTVTVPNVAPVTTVGGLLTQPTNIGEFSEDAFAVLPEASLELRYRLTPHVAALFGYSFMYTSNVFRAADQIDTVINSTQIGGGTLVGDPRPEVRLADSSLWLQGMNFGLEVGW